MLKESRPASKSKLRRRAKQALRELAAQPPESEGVEESSFTGLGRVSKICRCASARACVRCGMRAACGSVPRHDNHDEAWLVEQPSRWACDGFLRR